MFGLTSEINWAAVIVAVLLVAASVSIYGWALRGLLRAVLIIVIIGNAEMITDAVLPNNPESELTLRNLVDHVLLASVFFLAFGVQRPKQFVSSAWQFVRGLTPAKALAILTNALVVAAIVVTTALAVAAIVVVLLIVVAGLLYLAAPYRASPVLYTSLVFGGLMILYRFQRKAVFGTSIAVAISAATAWIASIDPILANCSFIVTAGAGCIVYGLFFLPAGGEIGWSRRSS